ncbi:MAG TPA: sortase [Candidatus Saccharimonadales bacterium]|nr:sortase [Candidatus Saccharimonadales bacterium]
MTKYFYQTTTPIQRVRKVARLLGLALSIIGLVIVIYIFSPLLVWQITLAPAFAQDQVASPIPHQTLVTSANIGSLLASSIDNLSIDYTDANNWYPTYHGTLTAPRVTSYFLSIPKLHIGNAYVSATDTDLAKHLVNLAGTPIPGDKGNTVIFGHSTLPQLFDPNNYRTIFATLHTMQVGDTLLAIVNNVTYTYKIFSISVVDPTDTSVLAQQYDDSYMTIITCTPPGTIWKRLVLKARLQKLQ